MINKITITLIKDRMSPDRITIIIKLKTIIIGTRITIRMKRKTL